MSPSSHSHNKLLIFSIIFSRGIYALTWFNFSAAFPAMAAHFHYSSLEADLGVFTASFLFGSGIFQVPAGILSARLGGKKVSLSGLLLISLTSLLLIFTGNFDLLLIIRFLTGVGTALFFAPALAIMTNSIRVERSGFAVGLYYAVFYFVGGVSVFVFAPLAANIDWRLPFIITAALTFVAFVENYYGVQELPAVPRSGKIWSELASILKSRIIWAAGISILGVNAGYYIASQFAVTYAETQLHLDSVFAGTISSLVLFGAIGGGPVIGWTSDHFRRRRISIFLSIVASGISLALLIPIQVSLTAVALFVLGFFVSASYVTIYAFPGQHSEMVRDHLPIGIGLINSLGILIGALVAPGFAYVVTVFGYPVGWLTLAIITAALGPAIFISKEPH